MNDRQINNKDDDNNPFSYDSEFDNEYFFDLNNDNNNKEDSGEQYIDFSTNPKEVKQHLKNVYDEYNNLESIFNNLIDKHKVISDIFKNNNKYREKEEKNESIINKIESIKRQLIYIKEEVNDLNNKSQNNNNNQGLQHQ